MVIGKLPVVVTLLTLLLSGLQLGHVYAERVDQVGLLVLREFEPAGHVASCEALHLLGVVEVSQTLTGKALLRYIAAPCHGISVHHSVLDDAGHVVDRHVP